MTKGRKKRKPAYQVRQLGALKVLPRDILALLLTYLDPNDILNVRQVSRALNQLVMDHPDQLPSILVRLTIEQMYQISDDFRPWIRNLTITDSERMTVEQLTYLVRAFPTLRKLDLDKYQGDNIEPLCPQRGPTGGLVNLQELYLDSYKGDLGPLRGLENLQELDLNSYQGENIEPLRGLVKLQVLDLNSYQGDIEPLRGLVNLQAFYLNYYQGDIGPLSGLSNLQELYLSNYRGDLKPLRDLVKLQQLDLWNHPDQEAVRALGIN